MKQCVDELIDEIGDNYQCLKLIVYGEIEISAMCYWETYPGLPLVIKAYNSFVKINLEMIKQITHTLKISLLMNWIEILLCMEIWRRIEIKFWH